MPWVWLISATGETKFGMARVNDAADLLPPTPWLFRENREAEAFTQEIHRTAVRVQINSLPPWNPSDFDLLVGDVVATGAKTLLLRSRVVGASGFLITPRSPLPVFPASTGRAFQAIFATWINALARQDRLAGGRSWRAVA